MCADFQFYLNRTGPRGPKGYKGDKGDDGKTPVPRTGTNTPIETTVIFDTGDGNPYETPNLKYNIEDRGGNMVMLDRINETQYYGTPDQATDNSYGVVKLATPESILDDPLDNDAVTFKLLENYVEDHTPQVGNGTITFTQGGVVKGTIKTNQTNDSVIALDAGGGGGSGTTYQAGQGLGLVQPGNIFEVLHDDTLKVNRETNDLGVNYGDGLKVVNRTLVANVDGTSIGTDANGALTIIGGGGGTPSNMVTTDTNQTITGLKTFANSLGFPGVTLTNIGHRIRLNNPTDQSSFGNLAYSTDIGDGKITLTQGTTTLGTFYVNQSGNTSIDIPASGGGGGSSYAAGDGIDISSSDIISAKVDGTTIGIDSSTKEIKLLSSIPTDTSDLTNGAGYITGITSGDVTTALGYTPYNSSNPNGYTSNVGTVTSVNNNSPDSNGNVTISMPNNMTGATSSTAGSAGLVPAPSAGDNDKFLCGDGTWKDVSGGSSVDAYTKTETDNLLKSKISGDSVDTPLEYTSPIDGYAILGNFPSGSTIVNTVSDNPSYNYGGNGYTPKLYIYSTSLSSYKNINSTGFATACDEQPYIETELTNGLNFAYKLRNYNSATGDYSWFGIVGGKYSGTTFIPTFTINTCDGSGSSTNAAVIDFGLGSSKIFGVGGEWNNYQDFEDFAMSVFYDPTSEHLYSGISNISHNTGSLKETTNLDSSCKQLLQDTTHIRMYTILKYQPIPSPTNGNCILDLSQTRFVNPDPSDSKVAYTGMNNTARYNVYINSTNLMIQSIAEQLTLKYDSNTLGVNSSNELYAISDNTKADTDLSNLSTTGEVKVANLGMPSNSSVTVTIPAENGTLTAPYNGYYFIQFHSVSNSLFYWHIRDNITTDYLSSGRFADLWIYHPVSKGTITTFNYGNVAIDNATFVKAIGEVNS